MATKRKTTKQAKRLASGKKMAKVKPLLKYNMGDVLISSHDMSGGGGATPSSDS
ncbi:MAG: hypothetical protein WA823_16910 [Candidatus Acidiferrales bacterium]